MKKLMLAAALLALAVPAAMAKHDALSLIPDNAVSVGVVRLVDLRTSPLGATLFRETDKISTDGDAEKFLLDGRFNVERLTSALVKRGAVKKNGYYILPEEHKVDRDHQPGAVAFPDGHLALIGSETAVVRALASRAAGGTNFLGASALGRDTARIDPHATAWAVVDVQRAQRIVGAPRMSTRTPQAQAVNSALRSVSTVALWATDSGDSLKLGAFGLSGDSETLGLLEDTLRGALSAMRLAVQDKQPDMVPVLRRFNVARTSDSVTITGSVPAETFKNWSAKNVTR